MNPDPQTPPAAGARAARRRRGIADRAGRAGAAAQRRLPLHAVGSAQGRSRRRMRASASAAWSQARLVPARAGLDGSALRRRRRRRDTAGRLHRHPARPVPREAGGDRDRPHAAAASSSPTKCWPSTTRPTCRKEVADKMGEAHRKHAVHARCRPRRCSKARPMLPELGQLALILALLRRRAAGRAAAGRRAARHRARGWRSRVPPRTRTGAGRARRSRSSPTRSSSQDFSVAVRRREFQLAAAVVLPLHRGLGRARRLAAAVGADPRVWTARSPRFSRRLPRRSASRACSA